LEPAEMFFYLSPFLKRISCEARRQVGDYQPAIVFCLQELSKTGGNAKTALGIQDMVRPSSEHCFYPFVLLYPTIYLYILITGCLSRELRDN
jgi:hypothetical protein